MSIANVVYARLEKDGALVVMASLPPEVLAVGMPTVLMWDGRFFLRDLYKVPGYGADDAPDPSANVATYRECYGLQYFGGGWSRGKSGR